MREPRIRPTPTSRAHNFLQPLAPHVQVILSSSRCRRRGAVFDWTRETPGIRETSSSGTPPSSRRATRPTRSATSSSRWPALVFVFWFGAWSRRVAYTVIFGKLKDIGIRQSLSVFAQYVVIVIGVLLTLTAIGFDVTTLTVFAASLGVGIGFGLQNVVNNFISGLLLLVERPLRIGDIVTVGTNSGTVQPDRHPFHAHEDVRRVRPHRAELGADLGHVHQLDAHQLADARPDHGRHRLRRRSGRGDPASSSTSSTITPA